MQSWLSNEIVHSIQRQTVWVLMVLQFTERLVDPFRCESSILRHIGYADVWCERGAQINITVSPAARAANYSGKGAKWEIIMGC